MSTERYPTIVEAIESLMYVVALRLACRIKEKLPFRVALDKAIDDIAGAWDDEINEFFGGSYETFRRVCRSYAKSAKMLEDTSNGRIPSF